MNTLTILLGFLLLAIVQSFVFPQSFGSRIMKTTALDMARRTGTVKFFDSQKGFGFITPEGGGNDVFVHQSEIHAPGFRSLREGEEVEFDMGENKEKGKIFAVNVTGPNGAYVQGTPREPFERNRN